MGGRPGVIQDVRGLTLEKSSRKGDRLSEELKRLVRVAEKFENSESKEKQRIWGILQRLLGKLKKRE